MKRRRTHPPSHQPVPPLYHNEGKGNDDIKLKQSNLNSSAGGTIYERAKSRRERHRLALMSSQNSAGAITLGRSKKMGTGRYQSKTKFASSSKQTLVPNSASKGPGKAADMPRDITRAVTGRERIETGLAFGRGLDKNQHREKVEDEEKVLELIDCGKAGALRALKRSKVPRASSQLASNISCSNSGRRAVWSGVRAQNGAGKIVSRREKRIKVCQAMNFKSASKLPRSKASGNKPR